MLSEPGNFAVVQLPGRKFPGVVCPGGTLHQSTQVKQIPINKPFASMTYAASVVVVAAWIALRGE